MFLEMHVITQNIDKICFPVFSEIMKMGVRMQNGDKICFPGLAGDHENERAHAK